MHSHTSHPVLTPLTLHSHCSSTSDSTLTPLNLRTHEPLSLPTHYAHTAHPAARNFQPALRHLSFCTLSLHSKTAQPALKHRSPAQTVRVLLHSLLTLHSHHSPCTHTPLTALINHSPSAHTSFTLHSDISHPALRHCSPCTHTAHTPCTTSPPALTHIRPCTHAAQTLLTLHSHNAHPAHSRTAHPPLRHHSPCNRSEERRVGKECSL